MLIPIAALLLTYVITLVLAGLAAFVLRRPLAILLSELCGTEERSSFWTVWSMVMMIALPLLFVSMARIATDPTELIQGTVACTLAGILMAMAGMGLAVWRRVPRPVID
ncbi:membrane protein of unknown function [Novosphingobium nitrogenifigens DSM 19370]|uniref:Uncharacterized protein n=1 Tax=Novosphingobium nitrogenifigens DSM 19370 TaxID=983920 RepID=F1Z468_9SPHN|nr:hypothetical protein [Novosphingobium nitrogenifigens]EGD60478.1 membrane protein of unknown function [Novosphingobium nitrogenifigens DSM 19370]